MVVAWALICLSGQLCHAGIFTVTSTADAGAGTLRQAITDANTLPGEDTITFNIGGTGPHIIMPSAIGLPWVTDRTVVDAYSQPGSSPNTLAIGNDATIMVQLDGSLTSGMPGLILSADSCLVQGFSIVNWYMGVALTSCEGSRVQGCFVGLGPNGTSAPGNFSGVSISTSSRCLIGGTLPADRNLISGNDGGVIVGGGTPIANRIEGNYVGTDRTGMLSRGNRVGITVSNGTDSCIVGGTAAGAGNLVSGNDEIGIALLSAGKRHTVCGNLIGLNAYGTGLRPNGLDGIYIDNSGYNLIGSGSAAGRNVVAGSNTDILIAGDSARHNVVQGNYIGTDASGTIAFIGPYVAGIYIIADSNIIGGSAAGQENVIGGHTTGYGIWLNSPARANVIRGNFLGIGADLTTPIPNERGIRILGASATGNQIGGRDISDGNVIWYNTQQAIMLEGDIHNSVLSNSISQNGSLGIDLWPIGVNPNDLGDPDTGPNNLQNFPVLNTATDSSSVTLVTGTLSSQPLQSYYVQLFSSSSSDPSGFGEGAELLDTFTVVTGLSGTAAISRAIDPGVLAGTFVTATATTSSGSTSEFSNAVKVLTGIYDTQVTLDTADVFFLQRADVDRDNYVDFVFTGNTKDSLFICYGKSDGTVEPPRSYFKIKQAAITVDYLNHDDLLDIVARTALRLYILTNQGNRNFSIDSLALMNEIDWRRPSAVTNPSVASGLFNGDAYRDVVTAPGSLLLGDGLGGFTGSSTLPFTFEAVDAGDMDGDGFDDLVAVSGDSVRIYLNNGAASFLRTGAARSAFHVYDVTSTRTRIDLNNDGKMDVVAISGRVAATDDTSTLFIGLGNGTGDFTSTQAIDIDGTALNFSISDVDKDNDLDISVINASISALVVYLNNAGTFLQTATTAIPVGTSIITALTEADINRDGSPDALIGGETSSPIVLAINQLPADPILPDEMVTTGYDNAILSITNPRGLEISPLFSTVAGSAYWRYDINGNDYVDDRAYDYNLQYGEYAIIIRPNPSTPETNPFTMDIRIDGSKGIRAFMDYVGGFSGRIPAGGMISTLGSLAFYYTVEQSPSMQPPNGEQTSTRQPAFGWARLMDSTAGNYQFQVDEDYYFTSPLKDTAVASPSCAYPTPLDTGRVYYWRARVSGGEWSRTMAAYIGAGCCSGTSGNVNDGSSENPDLSDLSLLIAYLTQTPRPALPCALEANINETGATDLSDLSLLIAYLTVTPRPTLPNCP